MNKIVAVRHSEDNVIDAYKTDDGRVLSRVEAVDAANAGKLEGVSSFTTRMVTWLFGVTEDKRVTLYRTYLSFK